MKAEPGWGLYVTCAFELVAASAVECCLTLTVLWACSSGQKDFQGPASGSAGEVTEGLVSVVPNHRS